MTIAPKTLAWLHHSAAVHGSAYSQVLLHLLERVEALEQRPIPGFVDLAAPTPEAAPVATDEDLWSLWTNCLNSAAAALRACYNLGRQHGAAQPPAAHPTPQPIPIPERLPGEGDCDAEGRFWLLHVDKIGLLEWHFLDRYPYLDSYNYYGYTHWLPAHAIPLPPATQPAPSAAPAGGLVERVAHVISDDPLLLSLWEDDARAAIREVAAWMSDHEHAFNAAYWLELEVDR